jgi:hypothetical protein
MSTITLRIKLPLYASTLAYEDKAAGILDGVKREVWLCERFTSGERVSLPIHKGL